MAKAKAISNVTPLLRLALADAASRLRKVVKASEPAIRVALWSDGTLEVRRDAADLVLFTKGEARAAARHAGRHDRRSGR